MNTLWLLDFDGVVNAVPPKGVPDTAWPAGTWVHAEASVGTKTFPLLAARPVLEFLHRAHAAGVDIVWHSYWQHSIAAAAMALGLPEFPVLDCPEFADADAERLPTHGRLVWDWWKEPAARRASEGRDLLWTDDDLRSRMHLHRDVHIHSLWPGRATAVLGISPQLGLGLTRKHLRLAAEFLGLG